MQPDQPAPRAKRTKEDRERLLAELEASGQSVREFARERGLPTSSVYQWVRAKKGPKAKPKSKRRKPKTTQPAFTEVQVVAPSVPSTSSEPAITVTLRCGHAVTFESHRPDLAWLRNVIKVVGSC